MLGIIKFLVPKRIFSKVALSNFDLNTVDFMKSIFLIIFNFIPSSTDSKIYLTFKINVSVNGAFDVMQSKSKIISLN